MTLRQIATLTVIGVTIAFVLTIDVAFAFVMTGHAGIAADFLYLVFFNPRGSLCVCVGMAIAIGALIYSETTF